ncbi:MAG: CBS domain-containing protein [Methanosphaera sp.]|uniref:CBS domain-containing protein n=1 Tax=Methanosphaera sp. TaxID=2666342 RepID=UPI0025E34B7D|nr:CBS domain-containing protein [Methanosphaera sp.]MCI5867752.1 CBS domain-containing protein [Methanosphaera sp.]MDD6535289.1 CBS domain-containing protein [Methanosphaera sp.]MDY3956450.1 CBS domain-containing protein [Methanosphaera sp.]
MLTTVQKEILQSLINLYRQAKCTSVKCESIAELMGRNSGTIRNQMQALRSLGLVQGVPGPRGGYKPTLEAYQTLNVVNDPCEIHVPIYVNGKVVSDISVYKIEFTSILRPGDCEATISVMGDIKQLDLDDEIKIGPTPVNNLTILGKIIGRDDVDNVLLIKSKTILSIPNIAAKEVATPVVKTITSTMKVAEICQLFSENHIKSAPVIDNGEIIGVVRAEDIIKTVAENGLMREASEFMNSTILTSRDNVRLTTAMDLLQQNNVSSLVLVDDSKEIAGVITFTDILKTLVTLIK